MAKEISDCNNHLQFTNGSPATIDAHSAPVGRKIDHYAYYRDCPLKKALVIVTLSTLFSGCAAWHRQPAPTPEASDNSSAQVAVATAPETLSSASPFDELPATELTRETMFQLLAAEIAFQRGDWQSAYATTLSVAQRERDPRLAQRAFEMAWIVKRPEESLAAARLWRTLSPHSEDATQNYLNAIVFADRLDEARTVFEKGLKDAAPDVRGVMIFQIERLLSRGKDKDAAFALLEGLLAPYSDMAEAHLALAFSAFADSDNARAQTEAQAALKIKPDSEQAAMILAQTDPDKEGALKFLNKFVAAHPNAKELRIAYARILIDEKRYKEAQHEFKTLLKAQPENLSALYMLGILEIQTNDTKDAELHLSAFLDALAKHPNDERDPTNALLLLAQIAEERKDNDAALRWLDQIESPDAYVGVQIQRAGIFAKQGNVEGARKTLAELKPDDQSDQIKIVAAEAQILRDANQTQQAMDVLAAGLKRFPDNTDLLYDYAMDAEKTNQLDICETTLRKIIELSPKNQQAYNALGYTFAERNMRLDEAYKLIETALNLAPDDPFIIDSMGWVQFRRGKLKEAEELLRRAYAIKPDPEIAVHLGEVLWARGQKADAHKLWREVSAKDPGNDSLKSTLARLHVSL
jgi:tetratricopeptide (TPR) repeat protein